MDKVHEVLLAALKQGAGAAEEQRLYRSGKLAGLFSGRTTVNTEVANEAIRAGLLEIVRTEARGKTFVEWVKVTPRGIDFVLQHESPTRVMEELRAMLQLNKEGLPVWLAQIRQQLQDLEKNVFKEIQAISQRLEMVTGQVVAGLKKVARDGETEGGLASLNWADDALGYLQQREQGGMGKRCPLPELFGVLRDRVGELSIKDFHSGLRRLQDRGSLRLLTLEGDEGPTEPEYALLEGSSVFYYASA